MLQDRWIPRISWFLPTASLSQQDCYVRGRKGIFSTAVSSQYTYIRRTRALIVQSEGLQV